jgi:hypothetical protein
MCDLHLEQFFKLLTLNIYKNYLYYVGHSPGVMNGSKDSHEPSTLLCLTFEKNKGIISPYG